jgi:cytochrome P450
MSTHDPEVDITRKSFWTQPPAERDRAFEHFRANTPVLWSGPAESDLLPPELTTRGFWSLTTYEDIRWANRSPQLFSSSGGVLLDEMSAEITEMTQSFIAMDAPRHTQLRGITMDAFKPGNMRRIESWIQGHARDLVNEMAHLGEGDFVKLVAAELPGRIFGSFFGLPDGPQRNETVRAGQEIAAYNDPEVLGERQPLEHVGHWIYVLHTTAAELAEARRAEPGDDLMTWLVQAEFEGERLTDAEIAAFFVLLATAANDTTRHATAGAVHALTHHRDARAALLEDIPGRIDAAVEEVLRWVTPLMHMRRIATEDIEVGGQTIRAGDNVVLWYRSANRDTDYWSDPATFDIFRSPNRHATFGGGGPHYCLGASLARTTLRAILTEVYTRIPDIEAPHAEFLESNFVNGIRRLPATWTPEQA